MGYFSVWHTWSHQEQVPEPLGFINQHTTHVTLHLAEKIVIKALHLNCMIEQNDNNLTCLRCCINYCGNDYMSMLSSYFRIISVDIHWSVVIMYS